MLIDQLSPEPVQGYRVKLINRYGTRMANDSIGRDKNTTAEKAKAPFRLVRLVAWTCLLGRFTLFSGSGCAHLKPSYLGLNNGKLTLVDPAWNGENIRGNIQSQVSAVGID